MIQRHPNCEETRCKVCMDDHWAIQLKLIELTGNDHEDHLGKFELFLRKKGIKSETEHGWGNENYFDDALMAEYVDDYIGEIEP